MDAGAVPQAALDRLRNGVPGRHECAVIGHVTRDQAAKIVIPCQCGRSRWPIRQSTIEKCLAYGVEEITRRPFDTASLEVFCCKDDVERKRGPQGKVGTGSGKRLLIVSDPSGSHVGSRRI